MKKSQYGSFSSDDDSESTSGEDAVDARIKNESAEREGFEPTVSFPTLVFKTSALNRSAISPKAE